MDQIFPGHLQLKEYNCFKILKYNVILDVFPVLKGLYDTRKYQKLCLTAYLHGF